MVGLPYACLLAITSINIDTIADLAGELGPMPLYASANAITGRAGLMPSRYQSDQVDHANGPLRRRGVFFPIRRSHRPRLRGRAGGP